MENIYIDVETGQIGTYDDFDYYDEDGEYRNAVDTGEAVLAKNDGCGNWIPA